MTPLNQALRAALQDALDCYIADRCNNEQITLEECDQDEWVIETRALLRRQE